MALDEDMMERRCNFTGNPCGTDTWPKNRPCVCLQCQAWLCEYTNELEQDRSGANQETKDLTRQLAEWQEIANNHAENSAAATTKCIEYEQQLAEAREEIARLRKVLEKIDVLCSDRQRIVMIGIQAFGIVSQITKSALEASDG